MSPTLRAVLAILCLLLTCICLFFAVLGVIKGVPLLVASPLLIAVATGYFNYVDYMYFFGIKK